MADRPILFSAPMIRALLASMKTQTRRVLAFDGVEYVMDFVKVGTDSQGRSVYEMKDEAGLSISRPSGKGLVDYHFSPRIGVSDRLWVKETHAIVPRTAYRMSEGVQQTLRPGDDHDAAVYAAGWERSRPGRWRPSIHMPRWASRLTLTVADVRVQRLQSISEEDAVAEGCFKGKASGRVFETQATMHLGGPQWANARDWYADLWDHINGADAWDANPWVVAYTFTVHHGNIDQIAQVAA